MGMMVDEGGNGRRDGRSASAIPLRESENDRRRRRRRRRVFYEIGGAAPRDSVAVASESVSDPLAMRPRETRCRTANGASSKVRAKERKREGGTREGGMEGRRGPRGQQMDDGRTRTDGRTDGRTRTRREAIRWRSGRERCLVAIEILH